MMNVIDQVQVPILSYSYNSEYTTNQICNGLTPEVISQPTQFANGIWSYTFL